MSDRSHPLVGLYTSALPVFRSRERGYDWNLVDSIGQPSLVQAIKALTGTDGNLF